MSSILDAPDTLSEAGASAIASALTRYWGKRGLLVDCRVEAVNAGKDGTIFVVRSDTVNAYPTRSIPSPPMVTE